jgi:hypothetical protein
MMTASQQPAGVRRDMERTTANQGKRPAGAATKPAAAAAPPAAAGAPGGGHAAAGGKPTGAAPPASGSTGDIKCTSRDLLENFAFTKMGYSSVLQAPMGLHCPGSKAAQLVNCMRQPSNGECKQGRQPCT